MADARLLTCLPDDGTASFIVVLPVGGRPARAVICDSHAAVLRAIDAAAARGMDCWFAFNGFVPGTTARKAANVSACRTFVLDVDVDPAGNGKYRSQTEVVAALYGHVRAGKLPLPTFVVSSGYGIHLYWRLAESVDPATWRAAAVTFRDRVTAIDPVLAADTSRVIDLAGLLRFPGAVNAKNPTDPRPVKILAAFDRVYTVESFLAGVEAAGVPAVGTINRPETAGTVAPPNAAHLPLVGLFDDRLSRTRSGDFVEIASGCAPIRNLVAQIARGVRAGQPVDVPYQQRWVLSRLLAYCKDGEATAAKLLTMVQPQVNDPWPKVVARAIRENAGIATCANIRSALKDPATGLPYTPEACQNCPAFRRSGDASPVNLPLYKARVTAGAVTAAQVEAAYPPPGEIGAYLTLPGFVKRCVNVNTEAQEEGYWATDTALYWVQEYRVDENNERVPRNSRKAISKVLVPTKLTEGLWAITAASPKPEDPNRHNYIVTVEDISSQSTPRRAKQRVLENAILPDIRYVAAEISSMGVSPEHLSPEVHRLFYDYIKLCKAAVDREQKRLVAVTNGWADHDGDREFLCGPLAVRAGGYAQAPVRVGVHAEAVSLFGTAGDPIRHELAMRALFLSARDWAYTALLAGFAAPLVSMVSGVSTSCLLNVSGPAGTAKTTVMRLGRSIWGDPANPRGIASPSDTDNAAEIRHIWHGNLPIYIDELARVSQEEIAGFVTLATNNRPKERMTRDSNALRANRGSWKTLFIAATNTAIQDALGNQTSLNDEGTKRRVMTLHANGMAFKMQAADVANVEAALSANYGFLGPRFVRHVLANYSRVSERIEALRAELHAHAQDRTSVLFVSTTAALLVAEELLEEMGIIKMGSRRERFLRSLLDEQKRYVSETSGMDAAYSALVEALRTNIPPGRKITYLHSGDTVVPQPPPLTGVAAGPLVCRAHVRPDKDGVHEVYYVLLDYLPALMRPRNVADLMAQLRDHPLVGRARKILAPGAGPVYSHEDRMLPRDVLVVKVFSPAVAESDP
jgi:hypothetical protein